MPRHRRRLSYKRACASKRGGERSWCDLTEDRSDAGGSNIPTRSVNFTPIHPATAPPLCLSVQDYAAYRRPSKRPSSLLSPYRQPIKSRSDHTLTSADRMVASAGGTMMSADRTVAFADRRVPPDLQCQEPSCADDTAGCEGSITEIVVNNTDELVLAIEVMQKTEQTKSSTTGHLVKVRYVVRQPAASHRAADITIIETPQPTCTQQTQRMVPPSDAEEQVIRQSEDC